MKTETDTKVAHAFVSVFFMQLFECDFFIFSAQLQRNRFFSPFT